jgi:hypothetical protein
MGRADRAGFEAYPTTPALVFEEAGDLLSIRKQIL